MIGDPEKAIQNFQSVEYEGVRANIPKIAGANPVQGFFNVEADYDGIFRRAPLLIRFQDGLYPHLALETVKHYYQREEEGMGVIIPDFYSEESGLLKKLKMPGGPDILCDENGKLLFNWYGEPQTIPTYSIIDIIEGKISKDLIKDKMVMVGPTALAIADLRSVPFHGQFPGVEMQATVVANILEGKYLTRGSFVFFLEILFMVILGTLLGWVVGRRRALYGFVLTMGIVGFIIYIDYFYFFLKLNIWLRTLFPIVGLFGIYLVISTKAFISEELARRKLKKIFDVYVHPSVIDQMLQSPEKFHLRGERKELSVFFSDIRGFTGISEGLEPEELVHFLNEYLTPMTEIILAHNGTVDKYIGDAIMGFWGAPLPDPNHPERACESALQMTAKLKELQKGWVKRDLPAIQIGIGINTGQVSVGNMGSKRRLNYTVMGDEVNLASRLEGLCKEYGCSIIIGSNTARKVRRKFVLRLLDRVRVKGKARGEEIHELMARRDSTSEEERHQEKQLIEIANQYAKGLELFWAKDWQEAKECFQGVISLRGEDRASQIILDQIERYRQSPPGPDWQGIRVMTTK